MAHYAQVNSDGIVVQVLVMDNDMETKQGEAACIAWLQKNVNDDEWVKTSYNGNIRKQYCGPGFTYNSDKDIFICPQPFASWALDSDNDWQAPVAMPDDASADKIYFWDEDVYQADNSKGWVLQD
jgi:hypothetical protein